MMGNLLADVTIQTTVLIALNAFGVRERRPLAAVEAADRLAATPHGRPTGGTPPADLVTNDGGSSGRRR